VSGLVVVMLGTDHHPFDRLVGWCDNLAASRPDIEVVVQHGWTAAPKVAVGSDFLGKDELSALLQRAHVAVTHGGPGLISDVRSAGLLPVVVPRDPERGEHVDGHQQRFVARMDKSGLVEEVADEAAFVVAVEKRLASDRGGVDAAADQDRVTTSVARFAQLVDGVLRRNG
jgi:UDP-N-acetylglucosamine transferase subunit ALG13